MRMWGHLGTGFAGALLVAWFAVQPAAAQSTFTVTGTGDPATAPCSGTVCPSLRDAVLAANSDPGATIQLGAAQYTLTQGELSLNVSMTIAGAGSSATTIQQTAQDRVIFAGLGTTTNLTGLTITGGNLVGAAAGGPGMNGGTVEGGGILNYGNMTLTGVVVSGNTATGADGGGTTGGNGGGALGSAITSGDDVHASSLTLVSSTIQSNVAIGGNGGAASSGNAGGGGYALGTIFTNLSSDVTLEASVMSGNQLTGGRGGLAQTTGGSAGGGGEAAGGIYHLSGGVLTITNSTISANTATGGAGGNTLKTGFDGAGGGGADAAGVYAVGATVRGSTISGNTATGGTGGDGLVGGNGGSGGQVLGAGFDNSDNPLILVNSTVTGNQAIGGSGGSGSTSGPLGATFGGGIYDQNATPTPSILASDTLASNLAIGLSSNSSAGNLAATGKLLLTGTLIALGATSGPSGGNCKFFTAPTDDGHNLEDTTPAQCGLSVANGDLIGSPPGLQALADNGGPTETRALTASSPALGAGGACTDPSTAGNQPLTVDQRGLPRSAGACDIGAFQFQAPAGAGPPAITGTPVIGKQLSCSQGSWTGDDLAFADQWLRDGNPIAGATSSAYTIATSDAGHQLACRVVASNIKGTATQTSAAVAVTTGGGGGNPPPTITNVHQTHRVWVRGTALARISRVRRHPVGTVFSFTLNVPARVRLSFLLASPGRKLGKRCLAPTRRNRKRPRCTRTLPAGSLAFNGHAGINRVAFQGRLSRTRALRLGSYTLRLTASNGRSSRPQTLRFRIVAR